MIFGFGKARHRDISAPELAQMLNMGSVQIVDVREAHEFAAGHIPDAINLPLSQFRPSQLPEARGRTLVLNCLGGKRASIALDRCKAEGSTVDTKLSGGFGAWRSAGFPVAY